MVCKGLSCVTFSIGFASDASPKGIARESCSGYTAPHHFPAPRPRGSAGCSRASRAMLTRLPPGHLPAHLSSRPWPRPGSAAEKPPLQTGTEPAGHPVCRHSPAPHPCRLRHGLCDFCSPIQTGFSPEHLGVTKESPWRASHPRTGSDCCYFYLFLAALGPCGRARASHCGISSSLIVAPRLQAPWLRSCDARA